MNSSNSNEISISISSIKKLSQGIETGDISPVNLVETCIRRIKKLNQLLNAFITVIQEEELYKAAQIAESQIKQGQYLGPLHGIPFSVKDIIYAKGVRCTAGSRARSNYISEIDSTSVAKLKKEGAILIGTNNLNEFASGITGINPFYGSTKNPWNISKISGGSSGGSAVAVTTGMVPMSLGTDTGGSIRVPSSFCGVVGLKPTYGRISRYGVVPLAPSLDHVGCIARSAWDIAAILEYIAGWDPLDPTCKNKKVPHYTKIVEESITTVGKKKSIGVPKDIFLDNLQPEIEHQFYSFLNTFRSMDVAVDDDLHLCKSNTERYYETWRDIRLAEATEIHLESFVFKSRPEDYSEEVRKMLQQGTEISAVNYIKAVNKTIEIRNEFLRILDKEVDAIVVPTTAIVAPGFEDAKEIDYHNNKLADKSLTTNSSEDKALGIREALLRNNIIFNSTGLPSVSIPIGLTRDNTPIGVQIIGAPFKEAEILSIAYNCESQNDSLNKFIPPSLSIDDNN
jgi:aspartyl-tRNA(Asn)/glutamyl-tRNA(Gln) amidotransferase subunit A